ncbi:MAG TPA: alkaline phosphatase D family protein [Actinoplanes sp.]|nr:alkaline phosphatase D family protein [Actinoplanes sp.]
MAVSAPGGQDGPVTAHLLIGPVLRRVVGDQATLWMEITEPASVRVEAEGGGSGSAHTFSAYGHHYAIVVVDGLVLGGANPYTVLLDDRPVWPPEDYPYPRSFIQTRPAGDGDHPVSIIFGSCREATPKATPRKLPPDALDAYARRLMTDPENPDLRPDLIMLIGDQVYADKPTPRIKRFLKRRRAAGQRGPDDQVVSFDEYTRLYLESWRDPEVRWLFATVPAVMIFDDHEIIDDWNTSAAWRAEMSAKSWWRERISAGLASYWVYQHLGNMSPDQLATDKLLAKITSVPDATGLLHDFGLAVDQPESAENLDQPYQWSFALDLGRTRLVVLDNRCNRILTPGDRQILPPAEWGWFVEQSRGDFDHLVVGSSLPWLMPPAIHYAEAWNERSAESANPREAAAAEQLRRLFDLEHWAAFNNSFRALTEVVRAVASRAEAAPASISVLSGDVHHSYVARADLGVPTPVHQLTCSPIHNQVPAVMKPIMRFGWSRAAARSMRRLATSAGAPKPSFSWRRLAGPYFGNAVSTLRHSGSTADLTIEGTTPGGDLFEVASVRLSR